MKITGVESICCGDGVKVLPPTKRKEDTLFECLKCHKPCEHYYVVEIQRRK